MDKKTGKNPQTLPDEALDQAAGGLSVDGLHGDDAAVVDPTSKAGAAGFRGGVFVGVAAGDVNNDGRVDLKSAARSGKPGA